MKKYVMLAALPLVLFAQSAFAALPPLWQGAREMKAILDSDQLKEFFVAADQIQEIVKGEDNTYFVRGNRAAVIVTVHYLPVDRPGPAQFTLTFAAAEQVQ